MDHNKAKSIFLRSANVAGWFEKEAAMLIAMVDEFQKRKQVSGHIFEIGVHHGKSSIFFSHLLRDSENLHICDLFGIDGNVSSSGSGNEQIFTRNMEKYGAKKAAAYHRVLSSRLTPEKIGSNYRLFHVDGGHNPDEALGDLALAAQVMHPDGIIILDDPFRAEWPGVTDALVHFLQAHKDFEAAVVGFNKLLLARKKIAWELKEFVSDPSIQKQYGIDFPFETKQLPFCNAQLYIFFIPTRYLTQKTIKVWLNRALLNKPVVRRLVSYIR